MQNEEEIFSLILHSGDARTLCIKALERAREGQIKEALTLIGDAGDMLNEAHTAQMKLIQEEINGESTQITLLAVHAQDHLMSSLTVRDLAKEIILMKQSEQKEGTKGCVI